MFLIPEFESFYHDAVKQGVKMLLLNFKDKTTHLTHHPLQKKSCLLKSPQNEEDETGKK